MAKQLEEVVTVPEGRNLPSGTVTFVFTDIEGSTKLFHALGDDYISVLDEHNAVMRNAMMLHGGFEVKTEGDAFFVAFSDPTAALLACRDAQLALATHPFTHGEPVRVRMGLHLGPVTIVDDDYVGLSVHEAARIAGAAHGGQILVSNELADAVASTIPDDLTFRNLGPHVLKDFPSPKHLFQLMGPGLDGVFPAPRTLTARGHNLPASPTDLIGRDAELLRVQELFLGDTRLVTLTGAGGFGKSRLAIELGWSLLSWFREGVWFVALAAIQDGADVVPTISRTLGITDEATKDPFDLLVDRLKAGPTMLLLDNLEQLGDGVVVVADLLAACPDLCILATSRERLRLRGENEVALDGLSIEDAVDLFVQRAEANSPCVDLDLPDERTAIEALVVKLDTIPLALELAAALVRDKPPTLLLGDLDRALDVLTEGERDLPQRQRTLRSAIAWSHDLLEERDRRLFELLSLFAGGASLPAIVSVADKLGIGHDPGPIAGAMHRLVDKALVRRSVTMADDDPARWWLLETVRQFAHERLAERPEDYEHGRTAHTTWFTRWAANLRTLRNGKQAKRFDLLERDIDNLRLALHANADAERAELAYDLSSFWEVRGHWREGVRWLEEVDPSSTSPAQRCRLLVARARLDRKLIELQHAEARLREARALAVELDDPALRSLAAAELSETVLELAADEGQTGEGIDVVVRPPRRMKEAKDLLDEAIACAGSTADEMSEAKSRTLLAKLLLEEDDVSAALTVGLAALALHRKLKDHHGAASALYTLSAAALQSDPAAAACYIQEGLTEAQSIGDRSIEGQLRWVEAMAKNRLGRTAEAFAAAELGYDAFVDAGDEAQAAGILFVRGLLANAENDLDGARTWMMRSRDAWRAFGDERRVQWCEESIAKLDAGTEQS